MRRKNQNFQNPYNYNRRDQYNDNMRRYQGRGRLGSNVAYGSRSFQNIGGDISKKLQDTYNEISDEFQAKKDALKQEQEAAGIRLENYIEKMTDDVDLSAIKDQDQFVFNQYLNTKKQDYYDLSKIAAQAVSGSKEKIEAISAMKSINKNFISLNDQLKKYGQRAEDYILDKKKGNISMANDPNNDILASNIFTGAYKAVISDDGRLGFDSGEGNVYFLDDVKDPFEKAWSQSSTIQKDLIGFYNKGEKLDKTNEDYYYDKFSRIIDDGGEDVLNSLAFDTLIANKSFFTEEEKDAYYLKLSTLQDPLEIKEFKNNFKQGLLGKIMSVADQRANAGYNKKISLITPKEKNKNAVELFKAKSNLFADELSNTSDNQAAIEDKAATTLSDKLTMQVTRNYGYHVYYDNENKKFVLFKPDQEESFEEGRKYSNNSAGIVKMLQEIDLSQIK